MNDHEAETQRPERALAGIGRFVWKLSIGTALAIFAAGLTMHFMASPAVRGPQVTDPASAPEPPARAQAAAAAERAGSPAPRVPAARAAAETVPEPVGPVAREIERRHAAGELSEAQRRFERCPGGDIRRVAWIDRQQRVLKLVHQRASGLVTEEWFDGEGRLREALVHGTAGGRLWVKHLALDERGAESVVPHGAAGVVPEEPMPTLVRADPAGAFFSGPGCGG
jgi:hypothetical protein